MQKKLLTNGNAFKRTDGRWCGVVWYMDEHGERKRKSFSGTTKADVNKKITQYIADFENAGKPGDKNSYIVANQWTFIENSNKRPDILLFLNGLPICLFELKSPSREQTDASEADSIGVPVCCSRRSGYSRFRYRSIA